MCLPGGGCGSSSQAWMPTYVSILRIPQMIWVDGGMILTGENWRTRRKTCPSATLSTTNPTWIDPGANSGPRGERPATNDLSYGTAHYLNVNFKPFFFLIQTSTSTCRSQCVPPTRKVGDPWLRLKHCTEDKLVPLLHNYENYNYKCRYCQAAVVPSYYALSFRDRVTAIV
jgi:hypothetical protein